MGRRLRLPGPQHQLQELRGHRPGEVSVRSRARREGRGRPLAVVSGFDGHPFHIHINPFLVCPLPPAGSPIRTKGRIFEPPFAHWRDTYLVNLDRKLDMLTEYRAFTGSSCFTATSSTTRTTG
jgi:hypothetical protein